MQARRTEAETFRAAPSGRWILAADGCASTSGDPGVLLLRRLGFRRAGGVAVATFGHTGLGMLICRCERVKPTYIHARVGILNHALSTLPTMNASHFPSF